MYPDVPPPPAGEPFRRGTKVPRPRTRSRDPRQVRVAAFLVVATMASLAGWALSETGLGDTGLYFITVPGLVAALIALMPSPDDDKDRMFGPIQLSLMVIFGSAIVIREGVICMIMASPLILIVVGLVTAGSKSNKVHANLLVPLVLLLGAGEGVVFDLPTQVVVTEERVLPGDAASIDAALANPQVLPEIEPLLFRLPFPKPTEFVSEGNELGDRTVSHIGAGTLEFEVVERAPGRVVWDIVHDSTPLAGWYAIDEIAMDWHDVDGGGAVDGGVAVEIAVEYDRRLAPAAYFDPLGRFGIGEFAEVLMDMIEANRAEITGGVEGATP